MKLGMSRAWAYQQAKVAIEGVKAIKERRTGNAANNRKRPFHHDGKFYPGRKSGQKSDFDPTSARTDEEIEAEMGAKIATVVQGIGLDLRHRRGKCSRQ